MNFDDNTYKVLSLLIDLVFFNRYKNYIYIYYGGKGISPVVWNIEVVESSKVDTEEVILETSILYRIKINLN